MAIKALGGDKLARAAVDNERRTAHPKWHPDSVVPLENYGYDVQRGLRVAGSASSRRRRSSGP